MAESDAECATAAPLPLIARPVAKPAKADTESSTAHHTASGAGGKIPVAMKTALSAGISAQSSKERLTVQSVADATPHHP